MTTYNHPPKSPGVKSSFCVMACIRVDLGCQPHVRQQANVGNAGSSLIALPWHHRSFTVQIEPMCYHAVATKEFCHTTTLSQMGVQMITIPELVAQALGSFLTSDTKSRFGSSHARLTEVIPFAARLTLDCIGNSDALYHNIEHSMLVTLAGHDILTGRAMLRPMTAGDYANFILACLTHDIGYVRGVVKGDQHESYVADMTGRTVRLPRGSSDAALAPYHVDRSKLFVLERLDGPEEGDAGRVARAMEYTRFPYTASSNDDLVEEEGLFLRAADLIGQLGDPNYLKKANALFYEFEEIGFNKQLGYDTPADGVYKYPPC